MHNVLRVWLLGLLATAATAASTVFNGILAVNNTSNDQVALGLRVLLWIGFGLAFVDVLMLLYFSAFYVRNIKTHSLHQKSTIWRVMALGVATALIAIVMTLTPLVWLTLETHNLSPLILSDNPIVWVAAWYGCWGISALAQIALYVFLGFWTKKYQHAVPVGRLDIDDGTRVPPQRPMEMLPDEHRSFNSRDTTIADLPRTPSTQRPESLRYSTSGKVPPLSASARMFSISLNRSSHSSFEVAFPAGEAQSIDSAFDRWDTSAVNSDLRAVMGSSPITRTGLETIPGSRPESPEEVVGVNILPPSPQMRPSSPQVLSSDTATVLGDWSSSPSRHALSSSPPSSPPNFSRPTSKQKNQPLTTAFGESSMQEIIHPLFRSSSPRPPHITTVGTMVTASPMANQPITPRTLATLRNHHKSGSGVVMPKSSGHWRAMPSVSQTSERRPSTAGSQGAGASAPGSPGPSIVDEEELPPILPGFVLSAGQRSSMLGYANRKSVKRERGTSQMSTGA